MKNILIAIAVFFSAPIYAQELPVVLKEAVNYERKLKEDSALYKYKKALTIESSNVQALVKSSLLSTAIGARQSDKTTKRNFYDAAKEFADRAVVVDSTNADVYYAKALVAYKLSEVETENKKVVAQLKDARTFAEKALAINANHGKANHLIGKWNFDLVKTAWAKKAALKVLYGGLPDATIENAFKYMEKSRISEPYFVENYYDLALAYKFDNKPSNAIEVLNKLVKLPTRTADDAALKAEGKRILSEMQ